MFLAAEQGFLPMVEYFIENGGDPYFEYKDVEDNTYNGKNILGIAAMEGSLNIVNYLLDNNIFTVDQRAGEYNCTPLHAAIEENMRWYPLSRQIF